MNTHNAQFLLLILAWFFPFSSLAQQADDWEKYLERMAALDDMDEETIQRDYELLSELAQHPIDINHATREDLEQLPFLTAHQIEDICAYLYHYAPLHRRTGHD